MVKGGVGTGDTYTQSRDKMTTEIRKEQLKGFWEAGQMHSLGVVASTNKNKPQTAKTVESQLRNDMEKTLGDNL